jgi:esterase/lipase superfamily enzyme
VIDLSDVKATDSSNHSKFAQLADVAPQLTAVLARGVDPSSRSKEHQLENGTLENIMTMPVMLLGAPIKIISGQ